jgi:arabinogalactan oligomer/maltooligosaccharide transport system permease protein
MTDTATAEQEREAKASRSPGAANLITKVILVGLIDVLLILALVTAVSSKWWLAVGFFGIVLVAVNVVYFAKRSLPLKYLIPGLVFLAAFQLYTMVFTG